MLSFGTWCACPRHSCEYTVYSMRKRNNCPLALATVNEKNVFLSLGSKSSTFHTYGRSSVSTSWSRSFRADTYTPDLYSLVHVGGWEPHNMHDLTHVSWVRSALYRSCRTYHNERLGSRWCRSWSVGRVQPFYQNQLGRDSNGSGGGAGGSGGHWKSCRTYCCWTTPSALVVNLRAVSCRGVVVRVQVDTDTVLCLFWNSSEHHDKNLRTVNVCTVQHTLWRLS